VLGANLRRLGYTPIPRIGIRIPGVTTRVRLAAYFSSQTPPATAAAAAPGKGEALFLAGDPARGIPPCQGCHGAEAGGPSISTGQYAAYPSLRGQYAPYLIARLTSFHKNLPHDTTNDFIMGGVAQTLDDESIQAIAAWLSSLTP
jgi:cytochrome c553